MVTMHTGEAIAANDFEFEYASDLGIISPNSSRAANEITAAAAPAAGPDSEPMPTDSTLARAKYITLTTILPKSRLLKSRLGFRRSLAAIL